VAAIGLVRSHAGGPEKLYLLLLWLLVPLVLPIAISIFFRPMFVERYAIVATPALYLLAAKGVEVASSAVSRLFSGSIRNALKVGTIGLAAAGLVALSSERLGDYSNISYKPQWREAVQYVNIHAQPHDLILFAPRWEKVVLDYYLERSDVETELVPTNTDMLTQQVPSILANIKEHDRVWAMQDGTVEAHDQLVLDEFFAKPHTLTYHERYNGLDLSLYEKSLMQD
jgi:hypothetical protein